MPSVSDIDWRKLYRNTTQRRYSKKPKPPKNSLGKPDKSDPSYQYQLAMYHKWKGVKKVAEAMETLGWSQYDISWYVGAGWESHTFTLPYEQFTELLLQLAELVALHAEDGD